MSKYVISDLHGCYSKFKNMLELIEFSSKDTLYILGDVIDRGENSLEIIDYIIGKKNIIWLKGNHEVMFLNSVKNNFSDCYLWFNNGGYNTYTQLIKKGEDYIKALYNHMQNLPIIKVVDKYILVHGGLYFPENYEKLDLKDFLAIQENDICLWDRSNINKEKKFKDYTIICGHTPVQIINNTNAILKQHDTIYIDCGCSFYDGRLSCLRLDDLKEFYI